jgi:hypothetical protein
MEVRQGMFSKRCGVPRGMHPNHGTSENLMVCIVDAKWRDVVRTRRYLLQSRISNLTVLKIYTSGLNVCKIIQPLERSVNGAVVR